MDDHEIVREGLRALLEREDMTVVGEASNGREAVDLVQISSPDCVVLDWTMPVLNGLDAAAEISQIAPRTKIIILTMHSEPRFVLEALRAGVRGYVLKMRASSDLLLGIREVSKGNIYLSPGVSQTVVDAFLNKRDLEAEPLTAKQRQILQLVAEGKTTKEIAEILGISTRTAESHRNRIMVRLDIHDTAGLVRYAIRHGLIQP